MTADELRELRAENEQLKSDVVAATAAARRAEAETGRLRGTIAEMQMQLARARQDQERFQRCLSTWRGARDRLEHSRRRIGLRFRGRR